LIGLGDWDDYFAIRLIGSFEPEHAGKIDFYLNLLNEKERAPEDQPSIASASVPRRTMWKWSSR